MSRKLFLSILILIGIIFWAYLYFERFLTEKEIEITIINSEKYADENEKYFIFTPHEVFLNENNSWLDKSNADLLFQKLRRGRKYKVIVVGQHIPYLSEFRNIIDIVEENNRSKSTSNFY